MINKQPPGDTMSILIRPEDWNNLVWQWTMTLYVNKNVVLACRLDVPPDADGLCPRKLELYACTEGFG
jgi:hypothetical protein